MTVSVRTHRYRLHSPQNARDERQRQALLDDDQAGLCAFCPDGHAFRDAAFIDHPYSATWNLIWNTWPHAGTKVVDEGRHKAHWVLWPHRCVAEIVELNNEEVLALAALKRWLWETFGLTSAIEYGRSGDPDECCTTITHLHIQICSFETGSGVWVRFGKYEPFKPKKHKALRLKRPSR